MSRVVLRVDFIFTTILSEGLFQNNLSPRYFESVTLHATFQKGETAPWAALKKSRT